MSDPIYYETMYILRPDIPEEEVESHLTKYTDLLKKEDIEVLDSQMRGKRRLAYPIGKNKEGIYVQLSHKGNGQQVALLERAMRLSEDVIRYLTVKQEGPLPTPKPSSTENKKDKEEDKGKKTKDKEASKENVKQTKDEETPKEVIKDAKKEEASTADMKETKDEATSQEDVKNNAKEVQKDS
tara:strand:- start:2695 stop:3243 length:549 start_codon:yes stop_codon:yes gene_type:complete